MGSFMKECALLFLVAALVLYDIEESGMRARQLVCLFISMLLLAPAAVFGLFGVGLLWFVYLVWRVVASACRGYWIWVMTLLSCNPCSVIFLWRMLADALEFMNALASLYLCGICVLRWRRIICLALHFRAGHVCSLAFRLHNAYRCCLNS